MDISSFRQSVFFKVIKNKYFITIVIFMGLMIFSPNNNIVYNFKIKKQLKELEEQKEFLKKEIESDSLHFLELEKSLQTAEKFGREKYIMKAEDEDIFIIKEHEHAETKGR